jgi:hypothetical protein
LFFYEGREFEQAKHIGGGLKTQQVKNFFEARQCQVPETHVKAMKIHEKRSTKEGKLFSFCIH